MNDPFLESLTERLEEIGADDPAHIATIFANGLRVGLNVTSSAQNGLLSFLHFPRNKRPHDLTT